MIHVTTAARFRLPDLQPGMPRVLASPNRKPFARLLLTGLGEANISVAKAPQVPPTP